MTPANVPFTKADLTSHVLRMCLHQWQDQYNLHEKGMTPVDMHSLQASLKSIEHVWQESFSEEQDRNQGAQYWSYEAGSQESLF